MESYPSKVLFFYVAQATGTEVDQKQAKIPQWREQTWTESSCYDTIAKMEKKKKNYIVIFNIY